MLTKENTYRIAFEKKKNNLKEKQRKRDMLLSALYASTPKLAEIESKMKLVGSQLAIAALSGDKKHLSELKIISDKLAFDKNAILKKAGIEDIKYDCDICDDTGYVSGKICDCIKKEAGRILYTELSKEMPLNNCCFENFDLKFYEDKDDRSGTNPRKRMTRILKYCKEYAINFNPETSRNILFMGETGLGKTHLTLAIVSAVIEKGYIPIYGSAENLFSMIETEKFSGEGKSIYDSILNCDLLVIDDLGVEMLTAFTKSVLYNLVNSRISKGMPTIINTNLSMKEIEKRYTARISSRLIGEYDAQKFIGKDIRQQKALCE